jgi:hypothetical protein
MRSGLHTAGTAASRVIAGTIAATLSAPVLATAQDGSHEPVLTAAVQLQPITPQQRREWVIGGVAAPKNVGLGLISSTWQTVVDSPHEWNGASGFAKRALTNEAQNGVSRTLEAGFGSFWGEDPRRLRSGDGHFGGRLGFAVKTVVLAPRSDGHLAPAWGRYAGLIGSSVVENAWLPSRMTTTRDTTRRIAEGLVSRLVVNLWTEFGPDLRRGLGRAVGSTRGNRPRTVATPVHESAVAPLPTKF